MIPCRLPGCQCTHTDGCVAGWLETDDDNGAAPCPTCRPDLARLTRTSLSRDQMMDRWRARNSALAHGASRDDAVTFALGGSTTGSSNPWSTPAAAS